MRVTTLRLLLALAFVVCTTLVFIGVRFAQRASDASRRSHKEPLGGARVTTAIRRAFATIPEAQSDEVLRLLLSTPDDAQALAGLSSVNSLNSGDDYQVAGQVVGISIAGAGGGTFLGGGVASIRRPHVNLDFNLAVVLLVSLLSVALLITGICLVIVVAVVMDSGRNVDRKCRRSPPRDGVSASVDAVITDDEEFSDGCEESPYAERSVRRKRRRKIEPKTPTFRRFAPDAEWLFNDDSTEDVSDEDEDEDEEEPDEGCCSCDEPSNGATEGEPLIHDRPLPSVASNASGVESVGESVSLSNSIFIA